MTMTSATGASASKQQEQRGGLGAHVGQPHRAAVLAPAPAARAHHHQAEHVSVSIDS